MDPHLTPREVTAWNAVAKGIAVARHYPREVVLAADTVVALQDEIIGKPTDFADAVRILLRLQGKSHHVYSSVLIVQLAAGRLQLVSEVSQVRFRRLSDNQIRTYLRKIDPLDKAGAYAAQGHGAEIIARIDGSYSNVVGLPMEQTMDMLNQFGIRPNHPAKLPARSPAPATAAPAKVRVAKPGKGTTQ